MKTRTIVLKVSLIAVFFLFAHGAFAAEATEASLAPALQDLSEAVGRTITTKKEAHEICNQEKYLTVCAEIGKKHRLYSSERVKEVDMVLAELKGKIIEQLKACTTRECLINVVNSLSKRLEARDPKMVTKLNLTEKKMKEHQEAMQEKKQRLLKARPAPYKMEMPRKASVSPGLIFRLFDGLLR